MDDPKDMRLDTWRTCKNGTSNDERCASILCKNGAFDLRTVRPFPSINMGMGSSFSYVFSRVFELFSLYLERPSSIPEVRTLAGSYRGRTKAVLQF